MSDAKHQEKMTEVKAVLAEQRSKVSANIQFIIARSKNANIVVYEGMVKDGKLDADTPMDVYWLDIDPEYIKANRKKGKNDDRVDLGMIEKKMAYGLSASETAAGSGEFNIKLVALSERQVIIKLVDGKPKSYLMINGALCEVSIIYVDATDNWVGLPTVNFVELHGIDADGNAVVERITK